jgi:uncharacterized protein (TIGR00369 family)
MTDPGDKHALLQELFEQLPAHVQAQALAAVERLTDRDPHAGPFGWLLGYHYPETDAGHARCIMDVTDIHLNPSGVAHGGVLCTLADAAMGAAAQDALEPDQRCVTAELKVNFLKAIPPGRIIADATVVHSGSRLVVATAEIHNADGDLVGVALGTFAVIARGKRHTSG